MKKIAAIVLAVLVLAIAAIALIPVMVPADRIRDQVVAQVKATTGRDLAIRGKVSVSVFPSLAVEVADVGLSSPPGFSADLIRLGALKVQLRVMPLLSGRAEVASFVLVDPVVTLETDRQGRANWTLATPPDNSTPAQTAPTAGPGAAPSELILGDIRIDNGRVVYLDGPSGGQQEIGAINLAIALPGLDQKLSAQGSAQWHGQKAGFTLEVEQPRAVMAGKTSPMRLDVTLPATTLTLSGQGGNDSFDGTADLNVTALRDVMGWAGLKAPNLGPAALGKLALTGHLRTTPTNLAISDLSLVTDAATVKGNAAMALGGARPALTATLAAEPLDLTAYLPASAAAPAKSAGAAKAGWSDERLDLSALSAADADVTLSVARLTLPQASIDKGKIHLVLKNSRLTADLSELALYQGKGQGRVVLDGAQGAANLTASLGLKGVQAEPALTKAADFNRLEGTGAGDIAITAKGASIRQLVGSLGGKGAVSFTNGAIKGINLAAMARNVTEAFSSTSSGTEKTDFSELSGTFTIASGIVTNKDLKMASPLLRVQGAGTVNLPDRSLDYRIEPKAVASLQGQGGKSDLSGLEVPIIVSGPWDALTWRPDLESLVKSRASQAVEQATGGLLGGSGSGQSLLPSGLFGR